MKEKVTCGNNNFSHKPYFLKNIYILLGKVTKSNYMFSRKFEKAYFENLRKPNLIKPKAEKDRGMILILYLNSCRDTGYPTQLSVVHCVSKWRTIPCQWPWQTAATALVHTGQTQL